VRGMKTASVFLFVALLFGPIFSGPAVSEVFKGELERPEPTPLVIKSKCLEVDNEQKVVTFEGEVNAVTEDFVLDCQKMLVYYDNLPTPDNAGRVKTKITQIIAMGQVKINRANGGMATAEKAVYNQNNEEVILTGNPMVKQGDDFVEGDRITVYIKENRSVVESSEDNKVRAIIFPGPEKR
jgi:lipopolysaccharide export system protein LptA